MSFDFFQRGYAPSFFLIRIFVQFMDRIFLFLKNPETSIVGPLEVDSPFFLQTVPGGALALFIAKVTIRGRCSVSVLFVFRRLFWSELDFSRVSSVTSGRRFGPRVCISWLRFACPSPSGKNLLIHFLPTSFPNPWPNLNENPRKLFTE